MSSLLHKLENNEAILLMYLAGELPEPDRVEVEQMLVNDAAMRIALADLTALQSELSATLDRADAALVLSGRESAVRRTTRAMAAVQARRRATRDAAAAVSAAHGPRLRFAWWAYPIAAAALLVIGLMIFSDRTPMKIAPPNTEQPQIVLAPLPRIFDSSADPAIQRLDQVEQEVLSLRTQDSSFFDLDTSTTSPDPDQ